MQTFQVHLTFGDTVAPTFSVKADSARRAVAKVVDLVDIMGGMDRLTAGYVVDSKGERWGVV